ncbi:MAG: ethanolamine ammonia-lyase subunit EutC [Gammaproteobacteria bacterium]|nr:ethanolamine ammonia-lyase subunit EutC [Gammaproteobacteria bacterium]
MPDSEVDICNNEPLQVLKQFTIARIALGSVGTSLPVKANLEFKLAHALARDSVSIPLDFSFLTQQLGKQQATIQLQSQVSNHAEYLQRPDKGRLLSLDSVAKLDKPEEQKDSPDIAIIVADGLSSTAIANHAPALLNKLNPELHKADYLISLIYLVKYARVAIGDPIGELVNAKMSVVLIGERPGLSSLDSMSIYFTYQPKSGNTDAQCNCISNIHKLGLDYHTAIQKLMFLIGDASRLQFSGVNLKDTTSDDKALKSHLQQRNFLLESF